MQPGRFFGEFFQEHGSVDSAAPAAAGVHDVGDARLDDLFVLVVERQAPELLAGFRFGLLEAVIELVVIGEDAGIHIPERDHDRAGQRGGIDQVRAAELARVVEAVGEHQATFGVGIDDLDGFARHGDLDIAGLLRFAGGHVFRGANDGDDFHLRFK